MFDHFPTTHATWIAERVTLSVDPDAAPSLARAARAELNAHVMQRHFAPLCAYVKGSAWRDFGEAADLVNGFFASRLERPEYLLQWRESGLALRRWLINGLLLHLHERARASVACCSRTVFRPKHSKRKPTAWSRCCLAPESA